MAETKTEPTQETKTESTEETKTEVSEEGRSILSYVFIAVLVVSLVLLMYYAYSKFVDNSGDTMVANDDQERDDPVIDFNLREAIKELQHTQKRVLSTLSQTMDM